MIFLFPVYRKTCPGDRDTSRTEIKGSRRQFVNGVWGPAQHIKIYALTHTNLFIFVYPLLFSSNCTKLTFCFLREVLRIREK